MSDTGTTPEDGAGLLAGIIMHLVNRGDQCPKAVRLAFITDTVRRRLQSLCQIVITHFQ